MVVISKDNEFINRIAEQHGENSSQYSVARIYGRPDETLRNGKVQIWYYLSDRVAFVFEGNVIHKVVDLLPNSKKH